MFDIEVEITPSAAMVRARTPLGHSAMRQFNFGGRPYDKSKTYQLDCGPDEFLAHLPKDVRVGARTNTNKKFTLASKNRLH